MQIAISIRVKPLLFMLRSVVSRNSIQRDAHGLIDGWIAGWTRTNDLPLLRRLLYQLSYYCPTIQALPNTGHRPGIRL